MLALASHTRGNKDPGAEQFSSQPDHCPSHPAGRQSIYFGEEAAPLCVSPLTFFVGPLAFQFGPETFYLREESVPFRFIPETF